MVVVVVVVVLSEVIQEALFLIVGSFFLFLSRGNFGDFFF